MINKMISQRSVVDVRAGDDACRGHRFSPRASFYYQGNPISDLLPVFGIFHTVIARVSHHCLESLSEERYVLVSPDETHMGDWVDERAGILDRAFLDYVRPQ